MTNLVMMRDQMGDAALRQSVRTAFAFGSAMAFFPFPSWRLGARYLDMR
jgi:uncharacterized protein (DUF2062 family)